MKKVRKSIFKKSRVKKDFSGFFVSIFLILCVVVGTGMKKTEGSSLFLTIRMLFCQEQGALVGANFVPIETEVYAETTKEYASAPFEDIIWHRLVVNSVSNLVNGDVTLSKEELSDYASISSCKISDNLEHIVVTAEMEQIPSSDDQYLYLFALESYQIINESVEPVLFTIKDTDPLFYLDWDFVKDREYLFDSFVLAVKQNGKYCAISDKFYITNPELIAENQGEAPVADSIKGLLLDPAMLLSEQLDNLSCKQIVYNIPIGNLLGETSDKKFPTIYYTYKGRTYALDGYVVAGYDGMFRYLHDKNIVITAIVLNNWSEENTCLLHPLSRDNRTAEYYEFNTVEETGCETLEAIASFLGERYSNDRHGLVSNWIIGNEINQREKWNYIAYMGVEDYVRTYESSFRIFYQAIKSHNANANVYFSIDQMWKSNDGSETSFYNGKEVLDTFNQMVKKHGDIDWGLALHPYSYPLNKVDCWTDDADYTENAPIVSMKNVNVATDYMQKEQMLNPKGDVRSIVLSEVGFTSTAGDEVQAAAFAYSYYMALQNPCIDAFLVNRMTDSSEEIEQGLALGLQTLDGTHKKIWDVFAHIDSENGAAYTDFALDIVGVKNWQEICNK